MLTSIKAIQGLGQIPSDRTAASRWLENDGIPISVIESDGRKPAFIDVFDLPVPERRAYYERQIENANLPAGIYDEAAHDAYLTAPTTMQETAERKAGIARLLLAIPSGAIWRERLEIVRKQFGDKGTSKLSLMRVLRAIEGVDPINFAPALLAGHGAHCDCGN